MSIWERSAYLVLRLLDIFHVVQPTVREWTLGPVCDVRARKMLLPLSRDAGKGGAQGGKSALL